MVEPLPTALALTAIALLLGVSVLASRASGRLGVPFALLFLVVGMAAGSEGIGRIAFEDHQLTFRIGTVALVLILFDGGLNTDARYLRAVLAPAGVLATVGVAGTALLTALGARALGIAWDHALLLGAIVSSTDAAAVFSALRNAGIKVRPRVGPPPRGRVRRERSDGGDPHPHGHAGAGQRRRGELGVLAEIPLQLGVGLGGRDGDRLRSAGCSSGASGWPRAACTRCSPSPSPSSRSARRR